MSWIWLTRVIGPIASPWYQAKKARNIPTAPRYRNDAHSVADAEGG